MNVISYVWRNSSCLFDPAQYFFNGDFWKVFKKKFKKYGNGTVLDIACGTGDLINYIQPRSYLGIDINTAYINLNRKRFKTADIEFLLVDATNFVIPKKYETAFFISAVHHFSDKQINKLCKNIRKSQIKNFIIVDGYPQGILKGILAWLDDFLAGGKYFRTEYEIVQIVSPYFKIEKKGVFLAKGSFYKYPYVIARN